MSNKFKPWIDSAVPDTNTQSSAAFDADAQRATGFKSGDAASSIRVNSALRQANLVAAALMNAIAPSSTLDLNSTLTDVVNEIKSHVSIDLNISNGTGTKSIRQGNNVASGANSVAFGLANTSSGAQSLTGGNNNVASATNSFAFGLGLNAVEPGQIVLGKYNVSGNWPFVVGWGTKSSNRKNLMHLTQTGSLAANRFSSDESSYFRHTSESGTSLFDTLAFSSFNEGWVDGSDNSLYFAPGIFMIRLCRAGENPSGFVLIDTDAKYSTISYEYFGNDANPGKIRACRVKVEQEFVSSVPTGRIRFVKQWLSNDEATWIESGFASALYYQYKRISTYPIISG